MTLGAMLDAGLDRAALEDVLRRLERVAARRWQEAITTPYGELLVKVMEYGGRRRVLPEYEACRQLG
jgi:uncharacterized protein (DUF111 family)